MTLQPPGVKPDGNPRATNRTPAQDNEAVPDPAARAGSALSQLLAILAKRLVTPPVDELDLKERTEVWATFSNEVLERKRQYDLHVNHMEWQRTWRRLVLGAGLVGLGLAAACLHRFLGLPLVPTTEIATGGVVATGGGVMLGILASVRRGRGSRHQRDRDSSSS